MFYCVNRVKLKYRIKPVILVGFESCPVLEVESFSRAQNPTNTNSHNNLVGWDRRWSKRTKWDQMDWRRGGIDWLGLAFVYGTRLRPSWKRLFETQKLCWIQPWSQNYSSKIWITIKFPFDSLVYSQKIICFYEITVNIMQAIVPMLPNISL